MDNEGPSSSRSTTEGSSASGPVKTTYQVRDGARLKKEDAEILLPVLQKMGDSITARALVDASTPLDSPTHRLFEWDQAKAADEFRLSQARTYIASFEVIFEDAPPVRAFPNIRTSGGRERAYKPMQTVLSSEQWTNQLVTTALTEMKAWRRRHEALKEVARLRPIFEALDEAEKEPQEFDTKRPDSRRLDTNRR